MGIILGMKPIVLSIEDDVVFSNIIVKALEADGFAVVRAGNGEDGLKRAKSEKPDVVLLDIGLPNKDGFEVLEELQSSSETSSIPVFMLSRLSSREDVDRCFSLGCTDYLIKTQHHPDDISRRLKRHLGVADGFARWEILVALGVVLIAASLLWWQIGHPKAPAPATSTGVELQSP